MSLQPYPCLVVYPLMHKHHRLHHSSWPSPLWDQLIQSGSTKWLWDFFFFHEFLINIDGKKRDLAIQISQQLNEWVLLILRLHLFKKKKKAFFLASIYIEKAYFPTNHLNPHLIQSLSPHSHTKPPFLPLILLQSLCHYPQVLHPPHHHKR